MSGFLHGDDRGPYEITPIKVRRWHGRRTCCSSSDEMIDRHVRPYFTVELGRRGVSWIVSHPTLEAGSTNMLYTALSGYESNQPPYPPGRAVP